MYRRGAEQQRPSSMREGEMGGLEEGSGGRMRGLDVLPSLPLRHLSLALLALSHLEKVKQAFCRAGVAKKAFAAYTATSFLG
jgi:hypothetical protein